MEGDPVKVCPRCGSEYQLWVERCLDCEVPLVHGREGQGAAAVPEGMGVEEAPAIPLDCVHLRTAEVAWIRRLSDDLAEAGIRHWVTPPEWRRDPSVYVLPSDQAAASRIDRERYALEVPDVGVAEARPRRPVPRREPSPDDLQLKVCPSCGGEYQLWAERL